MKLRPDEQLLTGSWLFEDGLNRGDPICKRIEWLLTEQLRKIASSAKWGDWEVLFVDPSDGRYWELTYPQGDLHGGGPPQISVIDATEAKMKYGLLSD